MVIVVLTPPELEELELEDELDELELEVLLLDELLLDELDEELDEDDELELLDDELDEDDELELLDDELEELVDELLELLPLGTEHSLIPPGTIVPAPKVTSPQIKLPFNVMKVN